MFHEWQRMHISLQELKGLGQVYYLHSGYGETDENHGVGPTEKENGVGFMQNKKSERKNRFCCVPTLSGERI